MGPEKKFVLECGGKLLWFNVIGLELFNPGFRADKQCCCDVRTREGGLRSLLRIRQ